jgi:uncharacterized protein (DUF58 family)
MNGRQRTERRPVPAARRSPRAGLVGGGRGQAAGAGGLRITARGVGLLVAGGALLGAGFGFGYPELTVLGTAALCAAVFAMVHAAWRPRLGVTRSADPDRVMRGEASRVTLTVRNASRLRAATLIAYDRCGAVSVPVPLVRLRPRHDTVTGYPVPTDRRGVVQIGPLRVLRRDPLALVTLARSHGGTCQVWVYPRVHALAAVPVGVARSLDGRVDRVPHGTITFDTLREYVIGDELRHVHWRTTARVGELMVREHLDTSLPRLVILLDDRMAAYPDGPDAFGPDAFESACEAAASVVVAASRADLPLALALVGRADPIGGDGRRHTDTRAFLDALAEAELHRGGATLAEATARLRQRRLGDTLVYLTGPGNPDDLGEIGALRGAYPSIVVGTLGSPDTTPSTVEGLLVLAAADGADFATAWDGVRSW